MVADLRTLQTELQALRRLAAGLKEDGVAVGVAVELLHGGLLEGGAAAGAAAAAGGAEGVEAGGAGLQQAQDNHRALAGQAGHHQGQAAAFQHRAQVTIPVTGGRKRERDMEREIERERGLNVMVCCRFSSSNQSHRKTFLDGYASGSNLSFFLCVCVCWSCLTILVGTKCPHE